MSIGKQTTNLASINSTQLRKFPVALPPLAEQQAMVTSISGKDKVLAAEQAQLDKLRQLKRGLMEDLLTGRVRVPEKRAEDSDARTDVGFALVALPLPTVPHMPPPVPMAAQVGAMFRASPGANPAAQEAWVEQIRAAVAGQQVGTYSPEALDALLPELADLSVEQENIGRVPNLLADVGIRFLLLEHPKGSKSDGAAFYLDEPACTQPVVALSFRHPYLDSFWFNLLHELGHIRLGHAPVLGEQVSSRAETDNDDERAAHAFARHLLIPEAAWQPFLIGEEHTPEAIRHFAQAVGRHRGTVAGRLANDKNSKETWSLVQKKENDLRPQVLPLLTELAARLKP